MRSPSIIPLTFVTAPLHAIHFLAPGQQWLWKRLNEYGGGDRCRDMHAAGHQRTAGEPDRRFRNEHNPDCERERSLTQGAEPEARRNAEGHGDQAHRAVRRSTLPHGRSATPMIWKRTTGTFAPLSSRIAGRWRVFGERSTSIRRRPNLRRGTSLPTRESPSVTTIRPPSASFRRERVTQQAKAAALQALSVDNELEASRPARGLRIGVEDERGRGE